MAVCMQYRNPQANLGEKEDSVSVIGKAITARDYASKEDRARAAYKLKDSLDKEKFRTYGCNTDNNNKNNKNKDSTVTNCAVYNATGDPIQLIVTKEWNGQVRGSYPKEIGNAQWGFFVHTKRAMVPEGSKAAVVYRFKNAKGEQMDWMSAWDNPRKTDGSKTTTHVCTETNKMNHFDDKVWPTINEKLKTAGHECYETKNGVIVEVSITEDSPANFDAVICLDN